MGWLRSFSNGSERAAFVLCVQMQTISLNQPAELSQRIQRLRAVRLDAPTYKRSSRSINAGIYSARRELSAGGKNGIFRRTHSDVQL